MQYYYVTVTLSKLFSWWRRADESRSHWHYCHAVKISLNQREFKATGLAFSHSLFSSFKPSALLFPYTLTLGKHSWGKGLELEKGVVRGRTIAPRRRRARPLQVELKGWDPRLSWTISSVGTAREHTPRLMN